MFSILRRIKLIEPNVRVCNQLLSLRNNVQKESFSQKANIPQALKRKKGKAKEETVSFYEVKLDTSIGLLSFNVVLLILHYFRGFHLSI